jgi:GrpB-like predicted nucleotidyltransferase (UPF0157 family)
METLEEKLNRVLKEEVTVVPYDSLWPVLFEAEKIVLQRVLPTDLIGRIEHFGSTAIPGMWAKPIVDMLVEVSSLEKTRIIIAPILEQRGYDYFWRASEGESGPPFYAWFIRRDVNGKRTHHIHMVESHFNHWDRLLFRDYLIAHPDIAFQYQELKLRLAEAFSGDRVAYTRAKTDFIQEVTVQAKEFCRK